MKNSKIHKVVLYIELWDHHSITTDWYEIPFQPTRRLIRTVGFFLGETDDTVYLGSIYDKEANFASGGMAVLKDNIHKMTTLKVT